MPEALLLFDIDMTLIDTGRAGGTAFSKAVSKALEQEDDLAWVVFHGNTDGQIAWDVLARYGHEHGEAGERVHQALLAAYLECLVEELPLGKGRVLPGAAEALERVADDDRFLVGLLTGNLRKGAELKLGHYGLWEHFASAPGAFADDHLNRNELPAIAHRRALEQFGHEFPPEKIWIIGDTPKDIACGRAFRTKVLAVASGHYGAAELGQHKPDLLLESLAGFDPETLLAH